MLKYEHAAKKHRHKKTIHEFPLSLGSVVCFSLLVTMVKMAMQIIYFLSKTRNETSRYEFLW